MTSGEHDFGAREDVVNSPAVSAVVRDDLVPVAGSSAEPASPYPSECRSSWSARSLGRFRLRPHYLRWRLAKTMSRLYFVRWLRKVLDALPRVVRQHHVGPYGGRLQQRTSHRTRHRRGPPQPRTRRIVSTRRRRLGRTPGAPTSSPPQGAAGVYDRMDNCGQAAPSTIATRSPTAFSRRSVFGR